MTSAFIGSDGHTDRFPTTPDDDANRVRVIAAIHGIARYLADNPDVPTPTIVALNARPAHIYDTPDRDRVEAIDRFALAHQALRYALPSPGGRHEYAKLVIHATPETEVTYTLSTTVKETH